MRKQRETFAKPMIKASGGSATRSPTCRRASIRLARLAEPDLHALAEAGEMPVARQHYCKAKFQALPKIWENFCASEAMQILGGAALLRGNRVERF